ncbi:MAG TPA: hypothetical protein VF812_18765 [Ktedonobacterales bacterium]
MISESRRAGASARSVEPDQPASEHLTPRGRWTVRGVIETLLIVIGLLANMFLLPHTIAGDGARRYDALSQLLGGRGISQVKYSLIGPIFAAPMWLLGKLFSQPQAWVEDFNTLIFALGLLALYLLLRDTMDGRLLRAFLLLLTLASMFTYHLTQFYGEVFTAMLVAVGLALVVLRRRGALGGLALVVVGVANTPATVAGLVLVLARHIWQTRKLRYGLALVAVAALVGGESLLRRGSALNDGYLTDTGGHSLAPFAGIPGFSYPLLLGLLSILFSFGKGLVFFTPGVFLPLRRRIAELWGERSPIWTLYSLWLCFVVGLILVYAKWWAWYGGWFWGPRFFLFACVPASFALALWTQRPSARLSINLLALGALALSVWVGIDGAVFNQAGLNLCTMNHYLYESYCHYSPDYSALWRPMVNVYLFGLGPRFASVEALTPGSVAFGLYALAVGVYLSLPLLRATWGQTLALGREWAVRLAQARSELRF